MGTNQTNFLGLFLKRTIIWALSNFIFLISFSQEVNTQTYKKTGSISLEMDIYMPERVNEKKLYPAMIFFFGGGWKSGKRQQFEAHAKHYAEKGIISILADYRIYNKHKTSPFEALKDAKSAIRYIRANANEFHIDTAKIIASGGSAGGHLAAATALIHDFNDESDDLSISCVPDALVLFNPVIDNGIGGYGFERIGNHYKEFSPLHNMKKSVPPTIFFLGTNDKHIPVETAKYYKVITEKAGGRCDLKLYEGEKHGFFNSWNPDLYQKTIEQTDKFLESLGYL